MILQCLGLCTGLPTRRKETGECHRTDGDMERWLCEEAQSDESSSCQKEAHFPEMEKAGPEMDFIVFSVAHECEGTKWDSWAMILKQVDFCCC